MHDICSVSVEKADISNARRFYLSRLVAALLGLTVSLWYSLAPSDDIPSRFLILFGPLLILSMLPIVLSVERLILFLLFVANIKSAKMFRLVWGSHFLVISNAAFFAFGNNSHLSEGLARLGAGITGFTYYFFFAATCLMALSKPELAAATNKFVNQVTKAKLGK